MNTFDYQDRPVIGPLRPKRRWRHEDLSADDGVAPALSFAEQAVYAQPVRLKRSGQPHRVYPLAIAEAAIPLKESHASVMMHGRSTALRGYSRTCRSCERAKSDKKILPNQKFAMEKVTPLLPVIRLSGLSPALTNGSCFHAGPDCRR
jgi:hypothetical protein